MPAEEATPWPTARTFAVFAVVAIASSTLSDWSRKLTRLPLITGYIAGGVLCGPYAIAILSRPESLQLAVRRAIRLQRLGRHSRHVESR